MSFDAILEIIFTILYTIFPNNTLSSLYPPPFIYPCPSLLLYDFISIFLSTFMCEFVYLKDIDWVQTEKHVFEQASNHPFLVGLHSCFQTSSRYGCVLHFIFFSGPTVKNVRGEVRPLIEPLFKTLCVMCFCIYKYNALTKGAQ